MVVLVRFFSDQGRIVERFLGIVHVPDTVAISFKTSLEKPFCKHGLSFFPSSWASYDGATNMRGEFNGLKALNFKDNSSANYVHYFVHQL